LNKIYAVVAVLIMVALVVGIIGVLNASPKPQTILEGFEKGLEEWVAEADVPLDPNNPGQPVEWRINRATKVSHSGQYSLELFIDGRQDDGTIWIERKVNVKKNPQIQVNVSFWLFSEEESFNTIAAVCAYVGTENPESEEDFAVLGPANEVAGWKNYVCTANPKTGSSEELWIAVGISVRWETHMTYYLDDVEIEIR
jgi:hypothetical protein